MATLKELIAESKPLIAPLIYDGISATVVRDLGFRAAYIGSYATSATKYGLPDIGYIGLDDMADQVRRLAPIVGVPVIADGEGGWGNPLHTARAVQVLERAGAAAAHIEDHIFGKHIAPANTLEPVDRAVDKIKAAVDAKRSEHFMIIARTDSPNTEGPAAAVDRALAYQEAGADGLFIAGMLDAPNEARLQAEATVPIFSVNWPGLTAAQHAADVILYFALSHNAALQGIRAALETLARESSSTSVDDQITRTGEFDEFLGIGAAREQAQKYRLI